MDKTSTKFQDFIKYILILLTFLTPLFFLPITTEAFEFNKMMLIILLSSVGLAVWGLDALITKQIKIAKTPFVIPGLILIGIVLLSSIFSIDKTSSIFGSSGRWFPSLIGYLGMGAFYLLATSFINTKKDIKTLIYSFFAGTTLATLIGIMSFYGIILIEGADRNFNPTGSLLTLGIIAALTAIMSVYELMRSDDDIVKAAAGLSLIVALFYLTLYNNPITWGALAFGIVGTLSMLGTESIKNKKLMVINIGILATFLIGVSVIPPTRMLLLRHRYPAEIQLPLRESWNISISTMRDFPLLGTGPSTFYLNYPRYRTIFMNQTDFWALRFDKPHNEVLLTVGTLGISGIIAGAYFMWILLKTVATSFLKEDPIIKVVAIMLLIMAGLLFTTHETVLFAFTMTLLMALLGAIGNLEAAKYLTFDASEGIGITALGGDMSSTRAETNDIAGFMAVTMALPLLIIAGLGLFSIYKVYPSEYYMQRALVLLGEDLGASYDYQVRAIEHNPRRSNYYNTYAQTNLVAAINLSNQEDLTQDEQMLIQNLIATAIRASKLSAESVSPLNPVNWEIQAQIYRAIRGAAQDADDWALRALDAAMQLDPTNPRLGLEVGGIYYAREDYLTAANFFRQAINLKPDYANAYYNFAQAAKNLEDYSSAKRALELTRSLLEQGTEDYALVDREISELTALLAEIGIQDEAPTVEELAQRGEIEEADTITEQEPLVIEGERDPLPEGIEDLDIDLELEEVLEEAEDLEEEEAVEEAEE